MVWLNKYQEYVELYDGVLDIFYFNYDCYCFIWISMTLVYGGTIQWVIDGTNSNLNWGEDSLVCHVWNYDNEFSNTIRLEIQILHNLFR
jgi:hypothetical protein